MSEQVAFGRRSERKIFLLWKYTIKKVDENFFLLTGFFSNLTTKINQGQKESMFL